MAEIKVPGLIGKKLGMTHVFTEDGSAVPVTVIEAGPCTITQVKTAEVDGYNALQLGFGRAKRSRVNKPLQGHFESAGVEPCALLKEFKVSDSSGYKVGTGITVEAFPVGAKVDVIGTSIGKGFTGVVKRHGFHGGPETHGSKSHDVPGSIGGSAYPGRVWPGQKLPGRAGGARVTIKKASVVGIDPDRNLLLLKGPVPGKRNSILFLKPSAGVELTLSVQEAPEEKEPADAVKPDEVKGPSAEGAVPEEDRKEASAEGAVLEEDHKEAPAEDAEVAEKEAGSEKPEGDEAGESDKK